MTIADNVFVDVCSFTRVGYYPNGQCNVSAGGEEGQAVGVYNPAGSTGVVLTNNSCGGQACGLTLFCALRFSVPIEFCPTVYLRVPYSCP